MMIRGMVYYCYTNIIQSYHPIPMVKSGSSTRSKAAPQCTKWKASPAAAKSRASWQRISRVSLRTWTIAGLMDLT